MKDLYCAAWVHRCPHLESARAADWRILLLNCTQLFLCIVEAAKLLTPDIGETNKESIRGF